MCEFLRQNKCDITKKICPYTYFCDRLKIWKPSKNMPEDCKVKLRNAVPSGYSLVRFERKGFLYIDIDGQTRVIKNPFDYVPKYVRVVTNKVGKIRLKK